MNILITSAGRQGFLVNAFKEALGNKGKIFASDIDENASALLEADKKFISPKFTDTKYIDWLVEVCNSNDIKLLITLNVDDLIVLEKSRSVFSGIGVFLVGGVLSNIEKTYDKFNLSKLGDEIGLKIPKTCLINDFEFSNLKFPVLAKPRFGKGSRGHQILYNREELNSFVNKYNNDSPSNEYILQEFIKGQEFGIDIINNFNSSYEGVLVREKILMKNGETYEAITVAHSEWEALGKKISSTLLHQGTIDVDIILFNGIKYVIDINHRFGGGYIFNHIAGAHVPKAYVNWILSNRISDNISNYLTYDIGVHTRRNALK